MMRIMELVFPLPTKLLHQIFFLVSLSQVMCLPTLLGGDLEKKGGNTPEGASVVFLCGWCFQGWGPWGRQLSLKHIPENCVWFFCAQQFTSPKDGPKGHLLSLKRAPNVPVLTAFPACSFHFFLPGFPDAERSFGEYALPRALQQPGSCRWIIICAPRDHVVKV